MLQRIHLAKDEWVTKEAEITSRLQKISSDVFDTTFNSLRDGMSEAEIADKLRLEFSHRGIVEFWYRVPLVVLIGTKRFEIGLMTTDCTTKSPSDGVFLAAGSPVHIDLHPVDTETKQWGDWSHTFVFHPRREDDEQIAFLEKMLQVHKQGITHINAQTTGQDVFNYYNQAYIAAGARLVDVRENVGHSIHKGPRDKVQRTWLDINNTSPLGEGIFTVEPGGICPKSDGQGIVVARFEDCIYIPSEGTSVLL